MSYISGGGGGGGSGALTVGVTPIAGGTSGDVLFDNAGVLGERTARTLLTMDTDFYVATTGNDSNDGSIGSPWLTLQHAMNFISANLDFASFLLTLNIGAGTFVGFGIRTMAGGGNFLVKGAGVGVTFITDGPNDGLLNGGEAISTYQNIGPTVVYVSEMTLSSSINNIFGLYGAGILQFGIPLPYGLGSIELVGTAGIGMVLIGANGINSGDTENPAGTVILSGSCDFYLQCAGLSQVALQSTYVINGTPTWAGAFIELFDGAILFSNAIFGGASTGKRFSGVAGAIFDTNGAGVNFFPGNAPGTLDSSSSYDGVLGSNINYQIPLTGFSITLNNTNTDLILDPAGALLAGTVIMAASPVDGQKVTIRTSQAITTLTINGNAGQTIAGYTAGTLATGGVLNAIFNAANTTWYF